jgi:hypothetical protein
MTAPLNPFRVHVADQVLAALGEAAPGTLSTPAIQDRTGYGIRHGQVVYQILARLAESGEVEKVTPANARPCYWRRLTPVISLPEPTVLPGRDGQDGGRSS